METIIFADVEGMVITYLKSKMPSVSISTKVPDVRPTTFIKVTQVGGRKRRINADSTSITFQCWASTTVSASDLARTARAHIHAMGSDTVSGVWVYKVEDVGAPAFNPDPKTDEPRYQFTVSIETKGEILV